MFIFSLGCAGPNGQYRDIGLVILSYRKDGFSMPTFHFHLRAGDELTLDHEGADFPDYSAALREATLAARELLIEAIKNGKQHIAETFVIADASGHELGNLPLIALLPKPSAAA